MSTQSLDTYRETLYVDPDQLRPYPGNPNRADVDELRGSVRRNGQYRPVIARRLPDGALEILAGHGTTEATGAEAGKVRIEVHDIDDATARRIVARDNVRPRGSVLDEEALLALLAQAEAEDGLDGTGYLDDDVDDLRALLDEADAATRAPTSGSSPRTGGEENVTSNNGLADLKDAYFGGTSRLVVLSYEGARYVWVVEALAALADRFDVDSNSDTIVALLEEATDMTAPAPGAPAPNEAANPPLSETFGIPRFRKKTEGRYFQDDPETVAGQREQRHAAAAALRDQDGRTDGLRDAAPPADADT